MILEVLWHLLAGVETRLELGVSDVAGYDDGSLEVDAGRDGILGELGTHGVDALVQVYFNALGAFSGATILFGDEVRGVGEAELLVKQIPGWKRRRILGAQVAEQSCCVAGETGAFPGAGVGYHDPALTVRIVLYQSTCP